MAASFCVIVFFRRHYDVFYIKNKDFLYKKALQSKELWYNKSYQPIKRLRI